MTSTRTNHLWRPRLLPRSSSACSTQYLFPRFPPSTTPENEFAVAVALSPPPPFRSEPVVVQSVFSASCGHDDPLHT